MGDDRAHHHYADDGCVGRCDAKCYHAWGPECPCVCQGVNHGVGRQEAIANTRELARSWLERAESAGQVINAGQGWFMTTLIAVYNSEGCVGRCDARCYDAAEEPCECICGGKNHSAGKQQAIDNTRELAEAWLEYARASGQDITSAEMAIDAMHEPLFRAREGIVMQSLKPWLAGAGRRPGARLIWASTLGLAVLAPATFYMSFRAQYAFMFAVKHQDLPALIEALIADVAMVVCSLLALGMACAGRSAKAARLLVVVFAGLSAAMNYLAADVSSFRSVAVYVMPPAVFAVCTDHMVSVVRGTGWASRRTPPGPG